MGEALILQLRSSTATGMPECEYLDDSRRCLHSIVEVITNATEVNAAHISELDVFGPCSNVRLSADKCESADDLFTKRLRSLRAIGLPPCRRLQDLVGRRADNPNGKPPTQAESRSPRRNSSPAMVSPWSASAIAASSDASACESNTNVSFPSGASTVTVHPSCKGSPSMTTLPAITLPLTIFISFIIVPDAGDAVKRPPRRGSPRLRPRWRAIRLPDEALITQDRTPTALSGQVSALSGQVPSRTPPPGPHSGLSTNRNAFSRGSAPPACTDRQRVELGARR